MCAYSHSDRPHGTTCSNRMDMRCVVPDNPRPMATRTGSFPLGFRRAGVEWQKDLPRLVQWSKRAGFDVIDLTGRATAAEARNLKDVNLAVGSVDLLDFGQLMNSDAAKRRELSSRMSGRKPRG